MQAKDAKLIKENEYGVELRYASRKSDTWPGYHETFPLGKAGYWVGTHRSHEYLGRGLADIEPMLAVYEF